MMQHVEIGFFVVEGKRRQRQIQGCRHAGIRFDEGHEHGIAKFQFGAIDQGKLAVLPHDRVQNFQRTPMGLQIHIVRMCGDLRRNLGLNRCQIPNRRVPLFALVKPFGKQCLEMTQIHSQISRLISQIYHIQQIQSGLLFERHRSIF